MRIAMKHKYSKYLNGLGLLVVVWSINFSGLNKHYFSAKPGGDPEERILARVDSVMEMMTLEEKIGQMTLFTSDWDVTGPTIRATYKEDIRAGKVGAIFNAHTAAYNRELQRVAVEETRLGIPLLFGYDVIHGYKTIFPVPLGEAASWDLEAIEKSARVSAVEAAAAGLHWTFAPMVDIARDPRWGRIMEGAGEDTYLGSLIAQARVKGFQGDDLGAVNTVVACAKHYAAYGAALAGRDYSTVDMSERMLREIYLPPFKAALDAGCGTFMTSFNELDGVPATANKFLLDEILRKEWHFPGFVVTDYTSIDEMINHGYSADQRQAAEQALNAGVDMDMQSAAYYNHLEDLVKSGDVQEEQIDQAVQRILRMKFLLGLFDDPYKYSDEARQKRELLSPEHLEASRDVARKSIVLLKNERGTLPLNRDIRKLAVIGPLADNHQDMIGAWSGAGDAKDVTTLLQGLRNVVGQRVVYAMGCEADQDNRDGFAQAINLAQSADAIVLAIGEKAYMSGEAASRSDITLPGPQLELAQRLKETGKPLIIVLMNGRPLAIPWLAEHADAIVETWFLGTQAGPAIADVLFGDYNPSGRLPVTFPRSVGQVPLFYNMKNTGRPMDPNNKYTSKYLDIPNTPLYPFGFGLSYTTFSYGDPRVSRTTMQAKGSITASVEITNTGKLAGTETVQWYIRDLVGSVTRPVRELKHFERVHLQPGESRQLSFEITLNDLKFYDKDLHYKAEPGDFQVFVGPDASTERSVKFTLN
ncbi:MAG: glycoside hydrolase family 3 N-terminal domain-containing protein [Saprospiraceae bacterium]